ncbi:tetratricopeptide repeat (TPR)-like superfamily protein [Tasmannia lanceolata]|uniref:tetratricopeptide repeat (TPR)-like superfamily protein n=1 Tax=Tasmannia lanceolata TaxID=3420 RepID=UPI0040644132
MAYSAKESNETLIKDEDSTMKESLEVKDETKDENVLIGESSSNGKNGDSSEEKKTLEYADELMEKGSKAIEDGDFIQAVDFLSRAVEIRVAHYGELAPECAGAYYKYGCALLYKSQEEADPLVSVPKKETISENSEPDKTIKCPDPVTIDAEQGCGSSDNQREPKEDGGDNDQEEDEGSDVEDEDSVEADEDESDLDLAWKLLDVARVIVEKQSVDTMEKVNILAALGEVSLEREDIETSLNDYLKALSILDHLVEPDHRRLAELNFRICLVLELGSRVDEALPYCQKAISVCKDRLQRLRTEIENQGACSADNTVDAGSDGDLTQSRSLILKKEEEIEILNELSSELEKKLEDLLQGAVNTKSLLSEVLKMVGPKPVGNGNSMPSAEPRTSCSEKLDSSRMGTMNGGGFDSPTVSTGGTDASVKHLGVVGRGVKRAMLVPYSVEPSGKKPTLDSSEEKVGSSASEPLISGPTDPDTNTI